MQSEQVEPDMSPLTRHEFTELKKALQDLDSKFSNFKTIDEYNAKQIDELIHYHHRIMHSENFNNKNNITELARQERETARKLEDIQSQLQTFLQTTHMLANDQNHQHTRANNLEMKLRKRGGLSKEHSIDYVPFINLPDKHKRGASFVYHRTRTTMTNKYILS